MNFFLYTEIQAQALSNLRYKKISTSSDTILLDTLSIIPSSILVTNRDGQVVDKDIYQIEPLESLLFWIDKPEFDSANVAYRVYPYNFFNAQMQKNSKILEKADEIVFGKHIYNYDFVPKPLDIFDLGDLNYYGNFSRGISVGSNQDLVVNSQFNLQMQGKLQNDISVRAAITDNNIPFQAQGNTQQLQEFDKIFIELSKNKHGLILGDYELLRPKSYFMNFQKRLQGIKLETANLLPKGEITTTAAAAVARGEYNRMQFDGQEGNQGPYKLIGKNGENYIVILSGSERVYIDGQLLTRGFNQDYVIDYNLAELVFTANRLITKDVRIVIEFEYSIQNYLRSMLYAQTQFKTHNDKLRLYGHFYSDQDAKNQPLLQELSKEKIEFLSNLGDNIDEAFFSGVDTLAFTENRVLYQKKDTLVNNVMYTVYAFSQNPETAVYALSFSNVGSGNGNYVFSQAGINGRVYQWVAPTEQGTPTGNFEPVIKLIAPQKKQLLTTGASYELKNKGVLAAEIGISNKDVNTFSPLQDAKDVGVAANVHWQQSFKLDTAANWQILNQANYEFVQARFEFLENYRSIEFVRDWNLNSPQRYNEHLGSVGIKLQKNRLGYISYNVNSLVQVGNYSGVRQVAENGFNKNGFVTLLRADYLQASANTQKTTFARPVLRFKYQSEKIKQWALGVNASQEKQRVIPYNANSSEPDTLAQNSLYFNITEVFLESLQSRDNKFLANWQQRWDYKPVGEGFEIATFAHTFNVQGELAKNPNNQLKWNMTYRNLEVVNRNLINEKSNQTILGEVNYLFEAFKGFVRSNSNYQLGSGQKQVVEYQFTALTNSLGTHVWQDLNDNGLKEIDEFRTIFANEFPDTTYIQITLPGSLYQRTNIVSFTQNLNIIPKRLWFDTQNSRAKFLNKWEFQTQIEIARHFPADTSENGRLNGGVLYSPFLWGVSQSTRNLVVSQKTSNRSALFFNRGARPFNGELFYSYLSNKDILVNGSVERGLQEQGTRLQSIFSKSLSANLDAKTGSSLYNSGANISSSYHIFFTEISPTLKWQNGVKLGVEWAYLWRKSTQQMLVGRQQELSVKFRYNVAQKSAFDGRFSYIAMEYNGILGANFNLENQILQGLKVGSNYVWNINFRTQLSPHLELRLNYNGKKSEAQQLQNTGRLQVTAIF